jgi:hypothetical protein
MRVMASLAIPSDESRPSNPIHFSASASSMPGRRWPYQSSVVVIEEGRGVWISFA